jgi:hexosaminidase
MVEGVGRENILGIEAPLWSETITNMDEIEYMIFPRLPGIAEIGWTPASKRDWTEYRERLAAFEERFRVMGIDFYKSPRVPWK